MQPILCRRRYNLYSITTNQAAIAALVRLTNQYVGNLSLMPSVFPDYPAPVVRNAGDGRELIMMRWGMPPPQGASGTQFYFSSSRLGDLDMPRQPFKLYADANRGGLIDIGPRTLPERPELLALVGKCLVAWPNVEAEMALALGQLLGANNKAVLAVFQTLRRSSAQRDAISEAGKSFLDGSSNELLSAILAVHKSVETERNALAHGHLGTYSLMPDAILWLSTADYIGFKATLVLVGDRNYDDDKREKLNSRLSYYKAADLNSIFQDIDMVGWIWYELISYLQELNPETRAAKYRQLCDRPRIAQELAKLRQKTNPSTQSQSPSPIEDVKA